MSPKFFRRSYWTLSEGRVAKFGPSSRWSNKDMDPVPPEGRTWTTWDFVAYWISDATNAAVWQLASSMLAVGLSWRQALPAIAIGNTIIAAVVVLNGTTGARLHVAFPVLNRSSFGFWFSYFSVVSRVVLAMFWFGIQTYTGSECIYQMLKAIWPSVAHIPNRLPESSHITTVGLMCYFLYWLVQLPLMFISPQNIRYFFNVKGTLVPIAWLSMLIWSFVKVPASSSLEPLHTSLHGSDLSWAWLSALNSALGIYATLSVNIPDFTRYAKNEKAQYIQLFIIPVSFTLIGFTGIAVTSAGEKLYGEILWDPLSLIDKWDNRAAAFFASFSFILATIGTNISANSLSAANDMTVLFPNYINIRRGQIICAFIGGWALCPWEILSSAPGFLSFMSGYTVFLGPFAGIMVADYWIVHKCKVDVPAMYDPNGRYQYWKGINWRAALTLLVSITPTMPGLINNINPKVPVGNASFLFNIAWLYGFFCSLTVYSILSKVFPAHETFLDKAILSDDVDFDTSESVDEISSQPDLDDKSRTKEIILPVP
ncbi:cytosine-purine permease [Pholiota conissans]|uniref:Cytosine-purine permease n=1 Tax=Pholiota conissans TaxID=109636 RepID=A0A9P5YXS9_9AGAR|nr:cytosine-purine permease [Pholiota conissans]